MVEGIHPSIHKRREKEEGGDGGRVNVGSRMNERIKGRGERDFEGLPSPFFN